MAFRRKSYKYMLRVNPYARLDSGDWLRDLKESASVRVSDLGLVQFNV